MTSNYKWVKKARRDEMGLLRLPRRIAIALGALALPPLAAAQTTSEQQMPEVKVRAAPAEGYGARRSASATKSDTLLIETPQSVSVITRERMQEQDVDSLAEALRYTPGIQGETFGFNPRNTSIMIRGFDASTTGLYRDGLQLRNVTTAQGAFNPEPYGAERIEVLRGPASVLYGQGSPGGLINFVSKRPPHERLRELEVQAGSFDRYEGRFDLGGPIDAAGVVSYRLTGLARDAGTQVDFIKDDRVFFSPALTWRPNGNTTLTVLASLQEDKTGDFQFLPARGTVLPNPNGRIPPNRFTGEPDFDKIDRSDHSIGYLFEHRAGAAWTFRQNLRYTRSDFDRAIVFSANLAADQRTLNRSAFTNDKNVNAFAVDNQAQAQFTTGAFEHTFLAGVDYQSFDERNVSRFGSAPAIDVFRPVYGAPVPTPPVSLDTDSSVTQTGLYLQDQIKFDKKWVLLLSGRHDWAETGTKDLRARTRTQQDDKKLTGRAGLIYLSDIGIAPYASYAESFLPIAGTNLAAQPFAPETAKQYELGVKYQPPGRSSFVTLAAFDLVRQNVLTPDPANPRNRIQTGEVRSRGVEVEGVADLKNGWSVIAGYTFLDAEITKSNTAGEQGKRPTLVPAHMASLWVKYAVQGGTWRGLGLGAGVRYSGSSFADTPNVFENAAFTVVDAAVYYDWRQFSFAINAKNLFDEEGFACFSGGAFCSFGPARSVTASARYRF